MQPKTSVIKTVKMKKFLKTNSIGLFSAFSGGDFPAETGCHVLCYIVDNPVFKNIYYFKLT